MTNTEAVQRTMENLTRVISEFIEADMRQKLQDCQKFCTQAYNHTGRFIEGDKVWFQPLNRTSWLGPVAVICQRGQSVWLHTHGDLKKVAACRVKPFKLIDRTSIDTISETVDERRQVMTEDGL